MSRNPVVIRLTESSCPRFLLEVAFRRSPLILSVHGAFGPSQRLLESLAQWAKSRGWARDLGKRYPELKMVMLYPPSVLLYDIFRIVEPWLERYYEFERLDRQIPDYAMAARKAVCQLSWDRQVEALLLSKLFADKELNSAKNVGVPEDLLAMSREYASPGSASDKMRQSLPRMMVNALIAVMVVVRGVLFILSRTRLKVERLNDVFMATDHMEDSRDISMLKALRRWGDIVLVGRMGPVDRSKLDGLDPVAVCERRDGRFSLADTLSYLDEFIRHTWDLARAGRYFPPSLFFWIVNLAQKRVQIRGLVLRFRPRYFWGRDPYNVDHILRHQELKKIGAKSFGMSDGIPVYCDLFPHLRYVSFDRFYVYGPSHYERHYRDHWPADMGVIGAASHSLTDAQLQNRLRPKPNDIVFFIGVFSDHDDVVDIVRGLSAAFPERTVYLQVKRVMNESEIGDRLVEKCSAGRPNVRYTTEPVYDLMFKGKYAFSDPSSVLFEAAQLGMQAFALDTASFQPTAMFREIPDICVKDSATAAKRIREAEAGTWYYPTQQLAGLIDLSGKSMGEVVDGDIARDMKCEILDRLH